MQQQACNSRHPMLVVQEQHDHLSLPLQVGKGSYSVPALHGPSSCGHLPWLCTGLDLFGQWLFWLGTKDFKVLLDGLEQFLVDLPRYIRLIQIQHCLGISTQKELCWAEGGVFCGGPYQACVAEFFQSGQLLLLSWNSAPIFPHDHWLHGS